MHTFSIIMNIPSGLAKAYTTRLEVGNNRMKETLDFTSHWESYKIPFPSIFSWWGTFHLTISHLKMKYFEEHSDGILAAFTCPVWIDRCWNNCINVYNNQMKVQHKLRLIYSMVSNYLQNLQMRVWLQNKSIHAETIDWDPAYNNNEWIYIWITACSWV